MVIATPNDLHYEHVKKWIKEGKNVFCEKPLTLTQDSSKDLYNLAEANGVRLYVDDIFNWFVDKNIFKSKNITFKWFKYGSFKANIIDNLAYHHFYLWANTKSLKVKKIISLSSSQKKIAFEIHLENGCNAEFHYSINSKETKHIIKNKNQKLVVQTQKNPLKDMLLSVFKGSVNFEENRVRTLNAVILCEYVKRKLFPNILVVGAGIFGSTAANILSNTGFNVTLAEKQDGIMQSASAINQYRLHRGYHYPRSADTARECLKGLKSFSRKYETSIINEDIEHFYGIAKKGSLVNGKEYLSFLKKINLEHEIVEPIKNTEITIKAKENLFDPDKLKLSVNDKLFSSGANLKMSTTINKNDFEDFDYVLLATYARINELVDKPKVKYQFEVVEKPVVRLSQNYQNKSIVIMDGPFMCLDPYKDGLHVLGNVVHAIHSTYVGEQISFMDRSFSDYLNKGIIKNPKITNIEKFIESGKYFFEDFENLDHIGSMYTIRTVLANRDFDDARPTLVNQIDEKTYTIFSGKIGTCVDAALELNQLISENHNDVI